MLNQETWHGIQEVVETFSEGLKSMIRSTENGHQTQIRTQNLGHLWHFWHLWNIVTAQTT